MFDASQIKEGLTFDDVLLVPAESETHPNDTDTSTKLTRDIRLKIPMVSAAMDTVTEALMAITMAQAGGIGILHRNMDIETQAEHVRAVKRYESGMVTQPITITPGATLGEALALMRESGISGVPVADDNGKLVGILTNRDVRFAENESQPVRELMTADNLIKVYNTVDREQARRLLHKHRIEKLLVVDDSERCIGLVTVKDIEKARSHPEAVKDAQGRLRVGAATGTGTTGTERAEALAEAGLDVIVIDTAHGHSSNVMNTIRDVRRFGHNDMQVIAGNVATESAARDMIEAGVDGIKVGIGPGSICTTRAVAGSACPNLRPL